MTKMERRPPRGQLSFLRDIRSEFDEETFNRIADAFSLDAFASLNRLIAAGDEQTRREAIHRLAGILVQYGFPHVSRHVEDYGSLRLGSPEAGRAIERLQFETYVAARAVRRIGTRSTTKPPPPKTGS